MASAETVLPVRTDWGLARPWPWLVAGAAASGLAFLWTHVGGGAALRFLLIGVSLTATGAAVCLRFRAGIGEAAVAMPLWAVKALAAVNGVLAAVLVFVALLLRNILSDADLPWYTEGLVLWQLLTAAWFTALAFYFGGRQGREVSARLEGAALLALVAFSAGLVSGALYLGADRAEEWDSMRLFFGVLSAVTYLASLLVAAPRGLRRFGVSVLLVLHIGGVATAVMSTPPSPWLAQQLWTCFYRPYLQFMYLNNAYRFYSPEPTPSTQVWFYVEYSKGNERLGRWFKLPKMDKDGVPDYPFRLQYQRRLALNENVSRILLTTPPAEFYLPNGVLTRSEYFKLRDDQTPNPRVARGLLGVEQVPYHLGEPVPYDPNMAINQQYAPPDYTSRLLYSSYARFVMRQPHPDDPEAQAQTVKIYRVRHGIATPQALGVGGDPCYPTFYLPYFMGEFNRDGEEVNKTDPFRYWLLPMIVDPGTPGRISPSVRAYVLLHAGDREHWVLPFQADGRPPVLR